MPTDVATVAHTRIAQVMLALANHAPGESILPRDTLQHFRHKIEQDILPCLGKRPDTVKGRDEASEMLRVYALEVAGPIWQYQPLRDVAAKAMLRYRELDYAEKTVPGATRFVPQISAQITLELLYGLKAVAMQGLDEQAVRVPDQLRFYAVRCARLEQAQRLGRSFTAGISPDPRHAVSTYLAHRLLHDVAYAMLRDPGARFLESMSPMLIALPNDDFHAIAAAADGLTLRVKSCEPSMSRP